MPKGIVLGILMSPGHPLDHGQMRIGRIASESVLHMSNSAT
jgi:hypothetical protein